MSMNLVSVLSESAARYPDADAVVIGPQHITYADLWEQTRRYATVLQEEGVKPGDTVAILLPNVPDFPRAYFAALSLGAVVVPVHALLVAREIVYITDRFDPAPERGAFAEHFDIPELGSAADARRRGG